MTDNAEKSTKSQGASTPPEASPEAATGPPRGASKIPWWIVGIIISAAALVCVGVGVLVGIHAASARRASPEALQDRYHKAEQQYRRGEYAEACQTCRKLRDLAPDSSHAQKARVLTGFAQTRIALEDGDVKTARRRLSDAEQLLDQLAGREGLRGWVSAVRADLELHPKVAAESAESERILTIAGQLLAQGESRAALHFLARELPAAKLSIEQQDQLKALRARIYAALFTDAVRRSIRTGNNLTDQGRYDKADWAFAEAQTNLQEAEQMGYLADEDQKALQAALAAGIGKLANARDFQAADEQIERAREQGKLLAERDALKRALRTGAKVRPSRMVALKQRLETVEVEIAFADALAGAEQAASDEAVAILEQFVAAYPEHAEAASALAAMKADRQWGKLIAEGDAAMRAGEWSDAHGKYQAASRVRKDQAVEDRLAHAEYEMAMQEARKARAAKRYDEALTLADQAARIYPPAIEQTQAWQAQTRQQQKYESDLREAKAALAAGNRKGALQILANMQPQTQEVLTLRDQAAYQEERRLALDAMRRRDYETAYAHLKAAKEHARPGEETRQILELMSRVEPLLKPAQPPAPPLRAPEPRLGLIRTPLYRPFGYGMYPLYSNGYFPSVTFGHHDQVYLDGEYYPIFYPRRRPHGRRTRNPRRMPTPRPGTRAGRPSRQ